MLEYEIRLARAKTDLVFGKPFFGSVALRVAWVNVIGTPMEKTVPTMATDGLNIYYNPNFVDKITDPELVGVIVHEIHHIILLHFARMAGRDGKLWNIATDYAINIGLKDAGYALPRGGLIDPQYRGMTAEQIYDRLKRTPNLKLPAPQWGEVMRPVDGDGKPLSGAAMEAVEEEVAAIVEFAIVEAETRKAGSTPGNLIEEYRAQRAKTIDWTELLERTIGGDQPDDYTMSKPNRRLYHLGGFIAPTIRHHSVGPVVVAIDTSGSMSKKMFGTILGILDEMIERHQPESVTIIQCDTKIRRVDTYERGSTIDRIRIEGRGGTRVTPVFRWIKENRIDPQCLLYFTDMLFDDWPKKPDYDVAWVNTGPLRKEARFGSVVSYH